MNEKYDISHALFFKLKEDGIRAWHEHKLGLFIKKDLDLY